MKKMDLISYLDENPEVVRHALSLVKIVDVNSRSVEMYEADTKEQLIENFSAGYPGLVMSPQQQRQPQTSTNPQTSKG